MSTEISQQITNNLLKINEHPELNNIISNQELQEVADNVVSNILPSDQIEIATNEIKKNKKKRSKDVKASNINEQCFAVTGNSSKGRIRCLNKITGEFYCNKCTKLAKICNIPGQYYTMSEKPDLFNDDGSFKTKNSKNKNNSVKKLEKGLFHGDINTPIETTYKVKVKEFIPKEDGEEGELEEIEVYKLFMNYSKSKLTKLEGFTQEQRNNMLKDIDTILSNPIYKHFKNGPWIDNLKPAKMKHGREKFLSLDALSYKWNGGMNSSWFKKKNKLKKNNKKKKAQHVKSFKQFCKSKGILRPLNVYMRVLNKYRQELTDKVKQIDNVPVNKINTMVAKLAGEKYKKMKELNQLEEFKLEYTKELITYKSIFNKLKLEWANMEHAMMLNVPEPKTTFNEYLKQLGIKKPLNIYMRVLKDNRSKLKKEALEMYENGEIKKNKVNTIITKKAAELYHNMSDTKLDEYKEAYLSDKIEYDNLLKEELIKYNESIKKDDNIQLIIEETEVAETEVAETEVAETEVAETEIASNNADEDEDEEEEEECEPFEYNQITYYKSSDGYLYDEDGNELGVVKNNKVTIW